MVTVAERVAVRLGLTEAVIRQLRARGHLSRLSLAQSQIQERLWRAHLAFLQAEGACARTDEAISPSD